MGSCSSKSNEISPSTPKSQGNISQNDHQNAVVDDREEGIPGTALSSDHAKVTLDDNLKAVSNDHGKDSSNDHDKISPKEHKKATPKDRSKGATKPQGKTKDNLKRKTKEENNHLKKDNNDAKTEKVTVKNDDHLMKVTIKTNLVDNDNLEPVYDIPSPQPPKLRKNEILKYISNIPKLDEHAKNASPKLKDNLPDLVNYLCIPSNDPVSIIRAIFVWVAYNIDYDADGYFGRAEKSQFDYVSVLKSGKSVCEGYANVVQALCKEAGIVAKKLSGFAKGFGHSIDTRYTQDSKTNHAWNAVFIKGNWFLLDSTWGAGNVSRETKQFERKFNEFYFLTDPGQFINSHYPVCKENVEESQNWQLLKKPYSLEQFNDSVKIQPAAFELGLLPQSHKESVIEFADELELEFKEKVPKTNKVTTGLYLNDSNKMHKEEYCCFAFWSKESLNIKVKPPKTGTYELKIYGKVLEDDNSDSSPYLLSYTLVCHVPNDVMTSRRFPYPEIYPRAFLDECEIIEPLGKQLSPHSNVTMKFRSPHLKRIKIQKVLLEKQGDTFVGNVLTPESGDVITVFGSREDSGSLKGIYKFCVG